MHIRFPSEHVRFDPSPIISCLDSLPKSTVMSFCKLVCRWLESSGASWTMDRLKTLRQRAIAVRGKQDIPVLQWYKVTKAKKLAGELAFIDSYSEKGSNAQFRDLIQLLSLFTSFKLSDRASEEDFRKQLDAMNHQSQVRTYPTIPNRVLHFRGGGENTRLLRYLKAKPWELADAEAQLDRNSWWDVALKSIKKDRLAIVDYSPLINDFSETDDECVRHAYWLLIEESIRNRRNVPPRQVFKGPFGSLLKGAYGIETPRRHEVPVGMGFIRYRVQPNGKTRFYAAPHPAVQHLLKPLGDLVYDLLRSAEWDCTFDQSAGVRKVQEWLSEDRECSSIDLTGATDHFPLEFQLDALKRMVTLFQGESHIYITRLEEHFKLFTYISRGEWLLPDDMCDALNVRRSTTASWKTGQPLGTYPSFGVFALGHALLALRACKEAGVPAVEAPNTFRILGDDIVISNPKVTEKYLAMLSTLGAPISAHKSVFRSRRVAEFAGKVITRNLSFYKPKYLPVTDKTCISLVDTFGPKVTKCYNPFQRALVSLPYPVGRELNSPGFSYEKRWEWLMRLESSDIDKRRVTSPSDSLRRKMRLDHVSDRPDLNVYSELPRVVGYAGLTPGPADDIFFEKNAELRRLWRSLPPYINPKSKFRYSYYTPSSWTRKARQVITS